MSGLDLNTLPDDIDIKGPKTLFCTHVVRAEIVEESPDNVIAGQVADGVDSGVHSAKGNVAPPSAPGGNQNIPAKHYPYSNFY